MGPGTTPLGPEEQRHHINYKEFLAVKCAVLNSLEHMQSRRAIVLTDSVTAAALLRRGGSARVPPPLAVDQRRSASLPVIRSR